jgi:GT2 family glycosyltransferase/membrane protein implicated in regulation of membrane protease activity
LEIPGANTVPGIGQELARPQVFGKFLYSGAHKLYVRGVTYGTFSLDDDGRERFDPAMVERDFSLAAANGINAVRTYTVPPRWLLDAAARFGLRVMVGLPWEQHVAFLDERGRDAAIERQICEYVRECAGHPSILCYAVGNEIPAPVVRWLGRRRVERFIERLFHAVKREDPTALVTYVNYPTTEYLQLPFLDLVSFNVYLEKQQQLEAYLYRLQHVAGDRPLIMTEVGLDSRRHGETTQARILDWQLRTIFESGCAGAFVFAWTDEWHRGGYAIEDWDFGLTRRDRTPKPALNAVRDVFARVPFASNLRCPRISVIVCAFNAQATLQECLEALGHVEYPDFEVIVVNDGSTDATGVIASQYPVRVITTPNRGLSNARNTGLEAANGEIVAYLDSDAFPDPHWLKYLAAAFLDSDHVGIGGPNVAPPGLGARAECFDNAPGGPAHVLLSDREAEHIPGCNMAFRRENLVAIGGFDPALRIAGDDVDVCWRLQERGWTLGFSSGAMVWHHRRTTLRSYWKQQRGYGRAEALLEKKWPEKYNSLGHTTWGGRIYGKGVPLPLRFMRQRIYHGLWGDAPYQSLEEGSPNAAASLPLMPEWYLLIGALAVFCALGALWTPLLWTLPLLAIAIALPLLQSCVAARRAVFETRPASALESYKKRGLTAFLHLVQPLARLMGRMELGLTLWRSPVTLQLWKLRPQSVSIWNERWRSAASLLEAIERGLRANGGAVTRGDEYASWDLEVRGGSLGFARLRMLVEEHGAGKQLVRFRTSPRCFWGAVIAIVLLAGLAAAAGSAGAWAAAAILGLLGVGFAVRTAQESAGAMTRIERAIAQLQ